MGHFYREVRAMKSASLASAILVSSLFLAGNEALANPEVGFDFSQTSNTIDITTISTASPNVLRTVTVVCPEAGHTVATANALFAFSVSNPTFPGTVAYSLTRNSSSFQSNHQHNVFGSYVDDFHVFPATKQRVDSCNSGQSVTYRFLATRGTNVFDVTASEPSLVVVYYRDRI
jgi:hypothetical protein